MYLMEDPMICLTRDPPSKSEYKSYVRTKIYSYHERELRQKSLNNSCMKYFNVGALGLTGRIHPSISNIQNTSDVQKMRIHTKMLVGNYYTYVMKARQSGGSSRCRQCDNGEEDDICHILLSHMSPPRTRILEQISQLCDLSYSELNFNELKKCKETLVQFILDPTSLNLKNRISMSDPILPELFKYCHTFCFLTDQERNRDLMEMSK